MFYTTTKHRLKCELSKKIKIESKLPRPFSARLSAVFNSYFHELLFNFKDVSCALNFSLGCHFARGDHERVGGFVDGG